MGEAAEGDAVNVFADGDGFEGGAFVDVLGRGVLEEDAVDERVVAELCDLGDELCGGGVRGEFDLEGAHADGLAALAFHLRVGDGRGVGPDEDGGEARLHAELLDELCHAQGRRVQRVLCDLLAIHECCGHGPRIAERGGWSGRSVRPTRLPYAPGHAGNCDLDR